MTHPPIDETQKRFAAECVNRVVNSDAAFIAAVEVLRLHFEQALNYLVAAFKFGHRNFLSESRPDFPNAALDSFQPAPLCAPAAKIDVERDSGRLAPYSARGQNFVGPRDEARHSMRDFRHSKSFHSDAAGRISTCCRPAFAWRVYRSRP